MNVKNELKFIFKKDFNEKYRNWRIEYKSKYKSNQKLYEWNECQAVINLKAFNKYLENTKQITITISESRVQSGICVTRL